MMTYTDAFLDDKLYSHGRRSNAQEILHNKTLRRNLAMNVAKVRTSFDAVIRVSKILSVFQNLGMPTCGRQKPCLTCLAGELQRRSVFQMWVSSHGLYNYGDLSNNLTLISP